MIGTKIITVLQNNVLLMDDMYQCFWSQQPIVNVHLPVTLIQL